MIGNLLSADITPAPDIPDEPFTWSVEEVQSMSKRLGVSPAAVLRGMSKKLRTGIDRLSRPGDFAAIQQVSRNLQGAVFLLAKAGLISAEEGLIIFDDADDIYRRAGRASVELQSLSGFAGLAQAVQLLRKSLLKAAQDPKNVVRLEQNEELFQQGVKDDVWGTRFRREGVWFTLYVDGKPVAMSVMSEVGGPPDLKPSPNIAYVADPVERGKGYGAIVSVYAAMAALKKYESYHMAAHVANVQSVRTIIATVGAMRALYGKRLRSQAGFIATAHAGHVPVLVMVVWLD